MEVMFQSRLWTLNHFINIYTFLLHFNMCKIRNAHNHLNAYPLNNVQTELVLQQ